MSNLEEVLRLVLNEKSQEFEHSNETQGVCVHCSSKFHWHLAFVVPHKHRILGDPWWNQHDLAWSKGSESGPRQRAALTIPSSQQSHLNQNLLWKQKEVSGLLRNMNYQGALCLFLFLSLPCVSNQPLLWEKNDTEVKGIKDDAPPFPLKPSLIHVPKAESAGKVCLIWEWIKGSCVGFVQTFCCSGKNEIHLHIRATKYELYDFSYSA